MPATSRRSFLASSLTGIGLTAAGAARAASSAGGTAYPGIPRIDVHTHVSGDIRAIGHYHRVRSILMDRYGEDLAFWINLGGRNPGLEDLDGVMRAGKGRMLCTIGDYSAHDGLSYPPGELQSQMDRGYVGYKIWCGPWYRSLEPEEEGFRYIDDPAHEPTFAMMEKQGILAASTHIADPNGPYGNRTAWCADPVEFWAEILAWRRVLERHPDLTVVTAHGSWLVCQDAQLDFLRSMFATFPKFHVDLAATFQYQYMVDRENLRDLMIEWPDRILFGTDIGRWDEERECAGYADRYHRCFRILETAETVDGGFFGGPETKGLELPREVLESIYWRNAVRLYPRLRGAMAGLGYDV